LKALFCWLTICMLAWPCAHVMPEIDVVALVFCEKALSDPLFMICSALASRTSKMARTCAAVTIRQLCEECRHSSRSSSLSARYEVLPIRQDAPSVACLLTLYGSIAPRMPPNLAAAHLLGRACDECICGSAIRQSRRQERPQRLTPRPSNQLMELRLW